MKQFEQAIKILCVDDELNVLRALERGFLEEEYEIVAANSGEEGLTLLESSGPFQVVISDYRMPAMNGVEFLRTVNERCPETVRIVLSGYADVGAIVAAINEGHIYKFVPKPWNDDELRLTIQKSLEHFFLRMRHEELLKELGQANRELEENVRQRTGQLELRNRELEFSQNLLRHMPAAVFGIDQSGTMVFLSEMSREILLKSGRDANGNKISPGFPDELDQLVEHVAREESLTRTITLAGVNYRAMGRSFSHCGSQSGVLLLMEV